MVQESTNTFSDGLISDLSSLTTPNTVLTDALNATLLTFNGNELVLQNDMGNTKIMVPGTELSPEYVQLPEGFIPIGMKEHGGVLYIVSTNGQEIEIGSFPSLPEGVDNDDVLIHITDDIKLGDNGVDLNKNFIISDKLNSGEKFLIVLNTENLDTISEFNGVKKYYKPKLLSIEKGIETDITNTLILQEKNNGSSFTATKHWFLPLNNSEYSTFNKADYINNKKYQIYKPKKGGTLALRFELETINYFTLQNITIVGNYLQFDFKIFGDSLIKPNKVNLSYKFTNISTGVQTSLINATPNTTFTFLNGYSTPSITISLVDTTLDPDAFNLNRLIEFTATCENTTYGIEFNKFVIKRTVDLSKESLNWKPTISYKVENIAYSTELNVTNIIIAKYGNINGTPTPMDRYNQPCVSSENQVAYYWNLLPEGSNNSLITDKKYDIVGTFSINNSTKKAENPILINGNTNENPLLVGNLPEDVLVTSVQCGYLYNSSVIENAKDIAISPWRVPDYNDFYEIINTINGLPFEEKELLLTGLEWDNLGINSTKFDAVKRGMIIFENNNESLIENAISWFYKIGTTGSFDITKSGIDIISFDNTGGTSEGQGSCIRLCSNSGGSYTDLDGNIYQSVKIGNLYWLTKDLKTTKFNDNTPLTYFNTLQGWRDASNNEEPSYTDFIIS